MSSLTLTESQKNWIAQYGIEPEGWMTLANSVYPGAKPESIVLAVQYCKARGLDVLKKPVHIVPCLLYTSPSPRDRTRSRMPSSA